MSRAHGDSPLKESGVVGLVLAAGQSTRMGTPKQLLPVGNKTVIEQVVESVRPVVGQTVVVLGHAAAAVRAVLAGCGVLCVYNADYRAGMVTSVQAGIRAAEAARAFLVCLGDQPGISQQVVGAVVGAWKESGAPVVVPSFGGRRGHPILVSGSLREEILALPASSGLHTVTRAHRTERQVVPVQEQEVLYDMDTPAQYRAFLRRHSRGREG